MQLSSLSDAKKKEFQEKFQSYRDDPEATPTEVRDALYALDLLNGQEDVDGHRNNYKPIDEFLLGEMTDSTMFVASEKKFQNKYLGKYFKINRQEFNSDISKESIPLFPEGAVPHTPEDAIPCLKCWQIGHLRVHCASK